MPKILVVDDDPDIGSLIQSLFEGEGLSVETLVDPRQALERVVKGQPDAVILDLAMPHKTGWQVLDELRESLRTRDIPVVVVSASAESNDRVRALRSGAEDFLVKPFDVVELLARVDLVLARRKRDSGIAGELKGFPLVELLQSLENGRKTGILVLENAAFRGTVSFLEGQVVAAQCGRLRGREAMFALLEVDDGCFQFLEQSIEAAPEEGFGSRLDWLLMESAWVFDELAARRHHLPAFTVPLHLVNPDVEIPEEFLELPLPQVLEHFRLRSGASLAEATENLPIAAQRVQFAVALLIEVGALGVEGAVPPSPVSPAPARRDAAVRRTREPLVAVLVQPGAEPMLVPWLRASGGQARDLVHGLELEIELGGEALTLWFAEIRLAAVSDIVARAARARGLVLCLASPAAGLEIPPRLLRAAAGRESRVLALGEPSSLAQLPGGAGPSSWRGRGPEGIGSLADLVQELFESPSTRQLADGLHLAEKP